MKYKILVNTMTGARILLTLASMYMIWKHGEQIVWITIITLLVYISDFLDGRLARKWNVVSKNGALFDVIADSIYIILLTIEMEFLGAIPKWFIFVIGEKLIEFLVTSHYLTNQSISREKFIFDFPGRCTAVLFYILPYTAFLVTNIFAGRNVEYIGVLYIFTTGLSMTASVLRIKKCFDANRKKSNAKCIKLIPY